MKLIKSILYYYFIGYILGTCFIFLLYRDINLSILFFFIYGLISIGIYLSIKFLYFNNYFFRIFKYIVIGSIFGFLCSLFSYIWSGEYDHEYGLLCIILGSTTNLLFGIYHEYANKKIDKIKKRLFIIYLIISIIWNIYCFNYWLAISMKSFIEFIKKNGLFF